MEESQELRDLIAGWFKAVSDGEWKAVQVHASVGIPNEELLGMELPG